MNVKVAAVATFDVGKKLDLALLKLDLSKVWGASPDAASDSAS